MFSVRWCTKTNRYLGVCSLYPLHRHAADNAEDAMRGIMAIVDGLDMDNETTEVDPQYEDTDVGTTPGWEPWRDKS